VGASTPARRVRFDTHSIVSLFRLEVNFKVRRGPSQEKIRGELLEGVGALMMRLAKSREQLAGSHIGTLAPIDRNKLVVFP
jgi:hypothetical protein